MLEFGSASCDCQQPDHEASLVAITGGPGGGKGGPNAAEGDLNIHIPYIAKVDATFKVGV